MSNAAAFLSALKPHEFFALVRKHHPWFTPIQAAAYLGFRPRTLESWRAGGRGPVFKGRAKSIRYHIDDLDAFAESNPDPAKTGSPPSTDR